MTHTNCLKTVSSDIRLDSDLRISGLLIQPLNLFCFTASGKQM